MFGELELSWQEEIVYHLGDTVQYLDTFEKPRINMILWFRVDDDYFSEKIKKSQKHLNLFHWRTSNIVYMLIRTTKHIEYPLLTGVLTAIERKFEISLDIHPQKMV